jgi:hypothetical protein
MCIKDGFFTEKPDVLIYHDMLNAGKLVMSLTVEVT